MSISSREAVMISYKWYLSPDQPSNKDELYKLQYSLRAAGIYLDLSWQDGCPVLSISAPEQVLKKDPPLPSENDQPSGVFDYPCTSAAEDMDPAPASCPAKRGRPPVVPENDLTLGRVHHMRFMNVPVKVIADEIGVSKRTFYRRWKQIEKLDLDPDTPFSQWIIK